MATPVTDAPILDSKFDENLTAPANNATRTLVNVRHGFREVLINNGHASVDVGVNLSPRCVAAYFYDASASLWKDLLGGTNGLIDRNTTGSSGTILDAWTNVGTDKLVIGSHQPFGGIYIGVTASVNSETATIAARYSKNDSTWANLTETDGTASGGATLAQDGNLTWTVPTDWGTEQLGVLESSGAAPWGKAHLYWVELQVSAVLSADVEIDELGLLHTAAADVSGIQLKFGNEYVMNLNDDVGALEFMATSTTEATTAIDVTWIKR